MQKKRNLEKREGKRRMCVKAFPLVALKWHVLNTLNEVQPLSSMKLSFNLNVCTRFNNFQNIQYKKLK